MVKLMDDTKKKSPTDMCVDKSDCHYQETRSKPTAETTKDSFRKKISPNTIPADNQP